MSANNIRNIDFRNFEYRPSCLDSAPVEVINGEASFEIEGAPGFFSVFDIVFGDLAGNGTEEAVVRSLCGTGGCGTFSEGFIFTLRNGEPTLLARIEGGDNEFGGIQGAVINNGRLRVERVQTDLAGEVFIEVTTHRLVGTRLVTEGTPERIPFTDNATVQRIQFEQGRTSATFERETITSDTFIIGARTGQTLFVNVASDRDNVSMVVLDVEENRLSEEQEIRFRGRLQETGDHTIIVQAAEGVARYTLEVTIPPS